MKIYVNQYQTDFITLLIKISKGTPGFEPGTSRSAVECSTTELYPHD